MPQEVCEALDEVHGTERTPKKLSRTDVRATLTPHGHVLSALVSKLPVRGASSVLSVSMWRENKEGGRWQRG